MRRFKALQVLRRQAGFTLIEIMIVMAISALLGATVLSYQGSLRQNAQFLDAVERARNAMIDLENQSTAATSTYSDGGPTRVAQKQTFFGKRLHFITGSSTIDVDTIVNDNSGVGGPNYLLSSGPGIDSPIQLPYGVTFDNSGVSGPPPGGDEVVFIQDPSSTHREVFAFYNAYGDGHSYHNTDLFYDNYNMVTSSYRVPLVYRFWDANHSHYCDITVNPQSGAITRGPII